MKTLGCNIQIGDILKSAKLVAIADLTNASQVATRTGLPAERVLVMLGLVTAETVEAAVRAQLLVRSRVLTLEAAAKAIAVVARYRVDLDRALEHTGCAPAKKVEVNQIGELLVLSGLLNKDQLTEALKTSQHLNLPLGRILVLKNVLTEQVVEAALNTLVMIRDGQINRNQAVVAIKAVAKLGVSIENCLNSIGVVLCTSETVLIGELLILAELVNKGDLLTALELSLTQEQQIGQVLIQFGFIDEQSLEAALELQQMVNNQSLSLEQAAEALKKVVNDGTDVVFSVPAVSHLNINRLQAVDLATLLHRSGLVTQENTEKALAVSYASKLPFNDMLLKYNMIEDSALQIAIRCHLLIAEGNLTVEQAIFTLHQCHWTGASLIDVLSQMGWMRETAQPIPILLAA